MKISSDSTGCARSVASGALARYPALMKILVVEDNRKLASFLLRALAEDGHVVDVVGDGRTALTQVRALGYDLVILDWMLPELDGIGVCRELRARGSRVPILMLTARAEVNERVVGLDAGADDYLPKPFDLGELWARVRALHRRSAGNAGALRVGPLRIDQQERRASINGKVMSLTPRELALLTYLAGQLDRVVPRTELLSKLWDMHFDPGSNVLEVHVKNLREKLGEHAGLIETVRGVGYRMSVADEASE